MCPLPSTSSGHLPFLLEQPHALNIHNITFRSGPEVYTYCRHSPALCWLSTAKMGESEKSRECCEVLCSIIAVVSFLISIPGTVIVGIDIANRLRHDPYRYSANDTRIISLDLTLCRGLEMRISESPVNATLYALSERPMLSDVNELIREILIQERGDHDYFFLYPGSNITMSACTYIAPYNLYFIKGRNNFESWKAAGQGERLILFESFPITALCSEDTGWDVYNTTATAADDWYLVSDGNTARAIFTIKRFEYEVDSNYVITSCTVVGSTQRSCIVSKPNSNTVTYLLHVGPGPNTTEVDVSITCALHPGLLAAIIVPSSLVFCCFSCITFCICICLRFVCN